MQDQPGRPAFGVSHERNLRVNHFVEVISVAFCKNFKIWLSGRLHEQAIPLARYRQNEARRKLIGSHIAIEQFWVNGDFFVLLWRRACARPTSCDKPLSNTSSPGRRESKFVARGGGYVCSDVSPPHGHA